ncbi:membrane protein (plasmid) [Halostagnicola larsenii XH-48]|uniref:Membrane protein n=1 Tax=Halostagnicola larsenii XH-48 TaxID=797299 RepID=W0JWF4_9EURY|nr:DUF2070 family protein [Halostagnicola larsenii]AHG01383.1 membrane protein [Halostagnicola larsenii XH-48]
MGADNVDIFKHIVFSLPPLWVQVTAMVLLSPVYAALAYLSFNAFAPVALRPEIIPLVALAIFFVPAFVAAELFYHALPDYPRHWSYFLALTNQLFVFVYALILSGADNGGNAWRIIWLALITVSLTNVLVLTISVGYERLKRILPVSIVQPVLLIATFQIFVGRSLGIADSVIFVHFAVLLVVIAFLVLVLKVFDYLIGSNANVSAFELTSGLLKGERSALDLGYPARPDVQTLVVDNGRPLTLAAPWVHPGPLGGFGGGELSKQVISSLNETGTGFFLHVPCTHKEDLADPDDADKILEAVGDPDTESQASKLYTAEYDDLRFYGRTIDGTKIVFFEAEGIDDYHPGIFMGDVSKDDVLLVDMHNHHIHAELDREIQYGTEEAARLKRSFDDFLERLEGVETFEYNAGFDVDCDGNSIMALVEEVDSQRTLIFGADTNGVTDDLRALRDRLEDEFDEVVLFSTDTHASVYELANMDDIESGAMESIIQNAAANVSSASLGVTNNRAESVRLLKLDYSGLIFSVNIIIRLVLISLATFYLLLIFMVF